MSSASAEDALPRRAGPRSGTLSGTLNFRDSAPGFVAVGVVTAGAAGYLLFRGPLLVAFVLCLLPLVLWLFARPLAALVLLGASIPITYSLTGGNGGFNLSPSDLLLVFVGAVLLFQAVIAGSLPSIRALKQVVAPVLQYGIFLLLLLAVHLSISGFFKTAQRLELFALPLVVGAFAALMNRHVVVLKAYVLSATVLAVVWPFAAFLGQKNPVGQMLANAILLLVGVRALRGYAWCGLLLVPGLLMTQSRGAILATGVGLVLLFLLQSSSARPVFARASVLVVMAIATFAFLPAAFQSRLTTYSATQNTPGAYSLYIRQQFTASAKQIIRTHPWIGIGVGNYREPGTGPGSPPQDPHNVLLLQAAEGGYGFAASFVLLIGGVLLVLRRIRAVEIAPVAAAVLLATVAHGLVDVYWVRATPVLGWLLVGMAFGCYAKSSSTSAEHTRS